MRDDTGDNPLADIDLAAWQPPPPPAGLANAVVARLRQAPPAALERSPRRWLLLGGVLAAVAAVIAIAMWGVVRAPRDGHGDVIASRPQRLDLDGTTVDLDTGAELHWRRAGKHVTATQTRGVARWTVGDDDELAIDTGAIGASVTTHNASLRVEVEMNLSDARLIGASAVTAAVVAMVTVIVYEGDIKASSAGQTVEVAAGTTIELRPGEPPRAPAAPAPVVGARAPVAPPADTTQVTDLITSCVELRAKHKWQDLERCAEQLRPLDPGKADELAANAKSEQKAELLATDFQTAVNEHDFALAAKLAAQIPADSVYAAEVKVKLPARPAALTTDDVLERLHTAHARLSACNHDTTTIEVIVTLAIAPSGAIAKADVTGASASVQACVHDVVIAQRFRRSPGGTYEVSTMLAAHAASPPPPNPCATVDTDKLLQAVKDQFTAGYHAAALGLVEKVLKCKSDMPTLRLAALIACRAHNAQQAKLYYAKLPPQSQAGIVQACTSESIDLDH